MVEPNNSQVFDMLNEGGEKLDLFQPTSSVAESTAPRSDPQAMNGNTESIHNMLMAAGMTPGIGVAADAADAILYAFEGEFGSAAFSAGAMIPIVGQYVSAQKALKKAKESGEKIVKVYRGVPKWFKGTMVKEGNFMSGGSTRRIGPDFKPQDDMKVKNVFYSSTDKNVAKGYATNPIADPSVRGGARYELTNESKVLEFHIPESWFKENAISRFGKKNIDEIDEYKVAVFEGGLPKGFLSKVHSYE